MFFTVEQIKDAHAASGGCWFSPDTMRFFKSRVLSGVYGGRYFVTSEQFPSGVRAYSVRQVSGDGSSISTVGRFGGYATAYQARAAARGLAAVAV